MRRPFNRKNNKKIHRNNNARKGEPFKKRDKNIWNVNLLTDSLQQMDATSKECNDEYNQNYNEEDEEEIAVGMLKYISDIQQILTVTIANSNKEH